MTSTKQVCEKIMRFLIAENYVKQVDEREVNRAITIIRGADERTLKNWKRALETLGYLKRVKLIVAGKRFLYDMDLTKCPHLLNEILQSQKQKRLL